MTHLVDNLLVASRAQTDEPAFRPAPQIWRHNTGSEQIRYTSLGTRVCDAKFRQDRCSDAKFRFPLRRLPTYLTYR